MTNTTVHAGLEGVVVAETRLSLVDGEAGELLLLGYPVEDLAGHIGFEALVGLFATGALPDAQEEAELRRALGAARCWAFERLPELGSALDLEDGMDALRAAVAHLSEEGPEAGLRVIAATAVFAAAWARRRAGGALVPPDPALPHAADYLRMAGSAPDPAHARALEAYLTTVSDHGMNASAFAARVVASTASDAVSAVVAGLGALKGKLHGGAPGPVLDMLDAIGAPERAAAWIAARLEARERIMGMGHRIYRVRDPRAAVLERAITALEGRGASPGRLELARAVEAEAERQLAARHPDRPLKANVEFYTAVLLEALGLPREAFTPTFAAGRVVGWLAHIAEQRAEGRLIRPTAAFVAPRRRLEARAR